MSSHRFLAILIASLMLLCGAGTATTPAPAYPKPIGAVDGPYAVVDVVDGDTLKLEIEGVDTTFRLIGVDTPETVHPSKPVQEFGKEASDFLTNLLAGEDVWITYEPTNLIDKYGRGLAFVWRSPDWLFVNLEIVRQGYGHALVDYPHQYMSDFVDYEARAREMGKGLWADEAKDSGWLDLSDIQPIVPEIKTYEPSPPRTAPEVKPAPKQHEHEEEDDPDEGVTVHITRTGHKYHRGGCRYLSKSDYVVTLAEAKRRGLGP